MAKIFGIDEKVLIEIKDIFKETNIEEIEIEEPDKFYIHVSRKKAPVQVVNAAPTAVAAVPVAAPTSSPVAPAETPVAAPTANAYDDEEKYAKIASPVIGTYYEASSPDVPAFVKLGDVVSPDTTVCIVEAMKVMNEIKAEAKGKIVAINKSNADSVQSGELMFVIEIS